MPGREFSLLSRQSVNEHRKTCAILHPCRNAAQENRSGQTKSSPVESDLTSPPYLTSRERNSGEEGSMSSAGKLAILVGGGPAPGINAGISSATIKPSNEGFESLGHPAGFECVG